MAWVVANSMAPYGSLKEVGVPVLGVLICGLLLFGVGLWAGAVVAGTAGAGVIATGVWKDLGSYLGAPYMRDPVILGPY